jgi:hypothetical protein
VLSGCGLLIRGATANDVFQYVSPLETERVSDNGRTLAFGIGLRESVIIFLTDMVAHSLVGSGGLVIPPGGTAPNLFLYPSTPGMYVRPTSWQVTRPTMLGDILETDMGFCVWGACNDRPGEYTSTWLDLPNHGV